MPLDVADPVERVVVLRAHLEQFEQALREAHGLAASWDLVTNYLNRSPTSRQSKLTTLLARSYNHLEGYLNVPTEQSLPSDEPVSPFGGS